jgi:hypothetical protein
MTATAPPPPSTPTDGGGNGEKIARMEVRKIGWDHAPAASAETDARQKQAVTAMKREEVLIGLFVDDWGVRC